ncbi:Pyruvate/Phosphoenolpyruvate kinase-like domain containing protein [Parasponia andersonii]|uniref:Pyruvate/Phosphoenolpyruvate kinase-like domain containing protein n=1 Tax=Parasponia andersonii TaxID=3476 RepID=A0A2P5D0S7_PARAD|nr:Pyruvate/Phosphoenolpyruvate kinase-like domain containing protein [Parasponia andersonii]
MSLQLQMQVHGRSHKLSLPYGHFFYGSSSPNPQSPISTLMFRSSIVQQSLFPVFYKSNASKWTIPAPRIVAAYSIDKDRVAESPARKLRRILNSPGVHQSPACFDALSAKLVERAGFDCCFASGFSISAARLGLPDAGLISYGEMVEQGRLITEAVSIPVIGDADTGYGNAMNVKRTVKGFIKAGFAGIMLEDQLSPKACGHTRGRKVVSREEAVMRIKAAIDARKESGSDIVIVARSDARQAESFEESLWRTRAFADAGADVLFIDALTSKQEMKAFCATAPLVPKMANMLEGGGKTPILDPYELEDFGYKLVVYPISLLGVSIQAMQEALIGIRGGHIPPPGSMPSFEQIKDIVGFNSYYEEEKRYAAGSELPSQRVTGNVYGTQQWTRDIAEQRDPTSTYSIGEPRSADTYNTYGVDGSKETLSRILSRTLRVKRIGRDGVEKENAKIPAAHWKLIHSLAPDSKSIDFKPLLDEASDKVGVRLLLDFYDSIGDRIQVFLE